MASGTYRAGCSGCRTLFLRTLRDDPARRRGAIHRLLVRAGYIRRAAPGGFTWLPLGWIVYRNVETIVRDEMDKAGFQEVHFPALLPRSPTRRPNRWTEYGDNLFRLQDRHGNDFLLAPTHEEMFTLLVKGLYSSYRTCRCRSTRSRPSTATRPAPRRPAPRPRVRDEGLVLLRRRRRRPPGVVRPPPRGVHRAVRPARAAVRHRLGHVRRDGRLGLRGVPRARSTSARTRSCGARRATTPRTPRPSRVPVPAAIPFDGLPAAQVVDTPNTPTIQTLVDHLNARRRSTSARTASGSPPTR